MRVFDVDWRWPGSSVDPSRGGSALTKAARTQEEALELGLHTRLAGLEVRRILDPVGLEAPSEAVDCYERLKPSYRCNVTHRRRAAILLRSANDGERQ